MKSISVKQIYSSGLVFKNLFGRHINRFVYHIYLLGNHNGPLIHFLCINFLCVYCDFLTGRNLFVYINIIPTAFFSCVRDLDINHKIRVRPGVFYSSIVKPKTERWHSSYVNLITQKNVCHSSAY